MQPAVALHLGRVEYRAAWALQRRVQGRLVRAKRAGLGEAPPHVVLLAEHPPVYTLGANGDARNLLLDEAGLEAAGAALVRTDRGGDVTFHGPGQLVAYPILDLDRLGRPDLHRYLRDLEEALVRTCADYGLAAGRVPGRTGVWIGPDARGDERKVCALGVRCSRWVTMHGLALNLNTDLSWFGHIVPCGIADRGVTSLAHELGARVNEETATRRFLAHFAAIFGLALDARHGADARARLDALAPAAETTALPVG